MTISRPHATWLKEHAIDPEVARRLGVFTAKAPSDLPEDFKAGLGKHLPGLVFPWSGTNGHTEYQLHPDEPPVGEDGRPRKYLFRSRKNGFSGVLWQGPAAQNAGPVLLVEGTKQFLAAVCWAPPNTQVYGLAGVHMWTDEQVPISDLSAFAEKTVVVIFDGDAKTNRQVFDAGTSLREALVSEGADVKFARMPNGDLDDLLAAKEPAERPKFIERLATHAKIKPADRRPKGVGKKAKGSETLPDPADPMAVARVIESDLKQDEVLTRRFWRGDWYDWNGAGWVPTEERQVKADLYARTEKAVFKVEGEAGTQLAKWSPTKPKIGNLVDALSGIVLLSQETNPGTWLGTDQPDGTFVSCPNGILRVGDRVLLEPDPRYFNLVSVPFEYDPEAQCPVWLQFLDQLWPNGGDGSVQALQEWFGYVLSGRTDIQKIMAIVGPKRAGKGTIARVLSNLVGKGNVAGPTLYSLGTTFGLSALLGRSLAIISDARLGGQANRELVVERLLTISGEDTISVDRKNKDFWVGPIGARLMMLSNELPRFADVSGTIASRFLALRLRKSWLNNEDFSLDSKLAAELPGILNWALEGLDRLGTQRRFTEPADMEELTQTMRHTASPVSEFVENECVIGDDFSVECDRLWQTWQQWCLQQGREQTGTQAYFGRDLAAVVPGLRKIRGQQGGRRIQKYDGVGLSEDYPGQDGGSGRHSDDDTGHGDPPDPGREHAMSDLSGLPQSDNPDVIVRHNDVPNVRESEFSLSREKEHEKEHVRDVTMTYYDAMTSVEGDSEWPESDTRTDEPTPPTGGRSGAASARAESPTGQSFEEKSEPGDRFASDATSELIFDIETASSDEIYSYGPGFIRLGGTKVGDQVHTEPGAARIMALLAESDLISGHNIMAFDLPALAEHDKLSFSWIHRLAKEGKLFDTILAARQDDPPMAREKGVDHQRKYDMASLANKLELGAKTDQLKELAKQHGGFDQIPLDDPEYNDYLRNDLEVSQGLLEHYRPYVTDPYLQREHRVAALAGQFRHNGFRVDTDLLAQRVDENREMRDKAMRWLVKNCGIPLADPKGKPYKDPLKTKAGKQAIIDTLERLGVTGFWRTPKSGDIQMDRDAMQNLAAQNAGDQRVVRLARAIMIVTGTRTVYQTMADNLIGDRIHPEINLRQSSGRWSYTGINLAALGKRGQRFHERDVLLPDEGHKILAVDLAQVDMRAVAGLSGDANYIDLFLGDDDAHTEVAIDLFGDESYRQTAKQIGHGWNYGEAPRTISERYEIEASIVIQFDRRMRERYPDVVNWQTDARSRAESGQLLDNGFGRKMRADPHRAWTQGPALEGQGAARDIMMEGLLRLTDNYPETLGMLRAQVHDEVVLSVPEDQYWDVRAAVIESLQFEWQGPGGAVPIEADASPVGNSWGQVYEKE